MDMNEVTNKETLCNKINKDLYLLFFCFFISFVCLFVYLTLHLKDFINYYIGIKNIFKRRKSSGLLIGIDLRHAPDTKTTGLCWPHNKTLQIRT